MSEVWRLADEAEPFVPRHAPEGEFREFLASHLEGNPSTTRDKVAGRKNFVKAYPDLGRWFEAPLAERIGRYYTHDGDGRIERVYDQEMGKVSYRARTYIYFLVLSGRLRLDWDWIIGMRKLKIQGYLRHVGFDATSSGLVAEGAKLGYSERGVRDSLKWVLSRLYLRTGYANVGQIGEAEVDALEAAFYSFGERPDLHVFFKSRESYLWSIGTHRAQLHLLRVLLYHRGQVSALPRKVRPVGPARESVKPGMEAVADRYVAARRSTSAAGTVKHIDKDLEEFVHWVAENYPEVESFAEVGRDVVLDYATALATEISPRTGEILAQTTRKGKLNSLSVFFRDTTDWGWEGVPGRRLLGPGDFPRIAHRIPRFIPDDELGRLMEAVGKIECPYQRGAVVIARWSGARRDEIRRLEVDCLDSYPDGTPRLRIPAGKTYEERLVPLHEEGAEAVRWLQANCRAGRGVDDPVIGKRTRHLFMNFGKLFGAVYLFDIPLKRACVMAGLVAEDGTPTITPHRFRHTVGTQLADRGARLHTIMKVLGHKSPNMSMVYAQISDREVLKDYRSVLGPGAAIAGPIAETLRAGELSDSTVDWIKTNFFKTELELGHCLRLPQEGPCECELYLSCAKFVTTKEYAPRLRARRLVELELIADAVSRGRQREEERHRCTLARLDYLLTDLGEPLEVSLQEPEHG